MRDGNEGVSLKARTMARLTARNASEEVVGALKRRAAEPGHRDILHAALFGAEEDFAARGKARRRQHSSVDSSETIRADRDRDGSA